MKKILVGVDGSAASHDALSWAATVATGTGCDLTAVRVFGPTQAGLPPREVAVERADELQEIDNWCSALPDGTTQPDTLLVDGDPVDALLAAAREAEADLLVVGGRGGGGFPHLHIGSVAHHLAHHTTLPLAIVPRTGATAVEHLVVGLDGSPGCLAAAELCADLASRLSIGVTAVYAFEPFAIWVPASDPDSWRHQATIDVRGWASPIEEAGVPLDIVIDRDIHPVAALRRAIDAHPGSAAVVGTRGFGGFTGLQLGRVPLQLVHHTDAPVILVPPSPTLG